MLLERLSARQLAEWMAYARIHPFGPHREDLRAATIALDVRRGLLTRRDGRPWRLEDTGLIDRPGETGPRPRWGSWAAAKAALASVLGGYDGGAPASPAPAGG